MWYKKKIVVQQNENFYKQKGIEKVNYNKIDKNKYIYEGRLGCWFKSYERKKPDVNDRRYIFEIEFEARTYYKRGFVKYEIHWLPTHIKSNVKELEKFKKENLC